MESGNRLFNSGFITLNIFIGKILLKRRNMIRHQVGV
jgi:hypothetical protein